MAETTHPSPRKVRWTVPAADTSVQEWLDAQENISRSLQVLIRETIQRDGYVDIVNRPVDQLPRRGRPPKESRQGEAGDEAGDEAGEDDHGAAGEHQHSPDQQGQHSPGQQDQQGRDAQPDRRTPSGVTSSADEAAGPASSAPVGGGQHNMDDIFGHGG